MSDLISRQAAIDWLTNEWDGMVTSVFDGIKNLPSAQPERKPGKTLAEEVERIKRELTDIFTEQMGAQPETHDKRTETRACDLISRQRAIAFVDCGYLRPPTELAWSDKDVVDMLMRIPSAQQWIPVSERLPEEYGNYLATMDDGDVQECTYSPEKNTPFMRGGWSTCEADGIVYLDIAEVIAWMPLPESYKGEQG